MVAAPRTEAQRMAMWDDCAGREAQRMAVWDGCAEKPRKQLCGTAVRTERPRGRDWLAAYRLALSEWDSSD